MGSPAMHQDLWGGSGMETDDEAGGEGETLAEAPRKEEPKGRRSIHDRRRTVSIWPGEIANIWNKHLGK